MILKESAIKEIKAIKAWYPTGRAVILPALYIAQREAGWLSLDAIESVAQVLNVPPAFVRGTATFYAMFKHKPAGRHLIQLCTNVSCMLFGADDLNGLLKSRYGLEPGGTSPDGRFSLLIMECIGACESAPAMLVNNDFHNGLNENNILELLERYK